MPVLVPRTITVMVQRSDGADQWGYDRYEGDFYWMKGIDGELQILSAKPDRLIAEYPMGKWGSVRRFVMAPVYKKKATSKTTKKKTPAKKTTKKK